MSVIRKTVNVRTAPPKARTKPLVMNKAAQRRRYT